ncbi:arf-GAP with GTPase, ANK repeat and PH domain-containing protein 3-like isoform X1 [Crassostrea angulata]|uniref:arf-GAP with GTPase, ANK repeat and PH domain-containing protein 1 isoform X1 n=1 Tax=Magallana gigas TaxID=29159 RepID=UPI000975117A|nr:arf-GAP with GTPase, ANK repeat and PH domain-containing protein 3 isoform X1 [Crassostrea gigas]XP_052682751.1 arf-GAP with GTPase, ANK repeat and PH domain-containing protein 3-like isoform X1 [Crassostrea angulata]|eukprot:XP_019921729.1 PREDICTED: arf-GAP with GTPase, ANK repeat and PH domain-containing protein 3 isoform X1 [Crassostrea gigas]
MNTRTPMQPYLSNSLAIRQEIQRFESVHPSIYAIYDLIDAIPDHLIQQQIREHVVCIEDSFVNSQEWTLSRSVPDLKLGILGSVHSGKSALVHRYLTGSYMQEESPEGGRFKKEVIIDGQSYLLLIRDEGGSPELQFTQWVDAVIFVFSLENEMSFQTVYSYYAKMCHYRNSAEIPLILVGTQDSISESNPRVIDDTRARKCATDLKRCSYYETCATYGLNVERVFQDACQKIVQVRYPSLPSTIPCMPPVPSTPIHAHRAYYISQPMANKPFDTHSTSSQSTSSSGTLVTTGSTPSGSTQNVAQVQPNVKEVSKDSRQEKTDKKKEKQEAEQGDRVDLATSTPLSARKNKKSSVIQKSNSFSSLSLLQGATDSRHSNTSVTTPILHRKNSKFLKSSFKTPDSDLGLGSYSFIKDKMDKYLMELEIHENTSPVTPTASRVSNKGRSSLVLEKSDSKDLPTPSSTPTQSRKNRRRSNLFNPKNKEEEKKGASVEAEKLGSGRVIPIKQGYLYKKSHGLNKEWKKKYVTLLDDGRLTYHPSLHDYMDDVHAKEINLIHTTVKIPGLRPRTTKTVPNYPAQHPNQDAKGESKTSFSLSGKSSKDKENVRLTGFDVIRERHNSNSDAPFSNSVTGPSEGVANGDGISSKLNGNSIGSKIDTPNVKKRHRRAKSGGLKNVGDGDDSDGYEFMIVSLENKQWHFEAGDSQERDEWINAIEQQILNSLQGNEINKSNKRSTPSDPAGMQAIRTIRGNNSCADCGAPNPDWASINLGTIVCIECSGIHRNLGTHLSRVRSLDLDEWPPDLVRVMMSIGNGIANSVWENSLKNRTKPGPTSPRDEKEKWIRAKYEAKEFLPPPPYLDIALNQQLIDALVREDIRNIILVLGHSRAEDINCPYSKDDGRTALHIAAALGNVVYVQLLLWYNANVKVVDHEGRNALWYARSSGSTECVELLMNNGCPEHPTLPRRRGSSAQAGKNDVFEKLPASVI